MTYALLFCIICKRFLEELKKKLRPVSLYKLSFRQVLFLTGAKDKTKAKLSVMKWIAAFDRYSVAVAAADQMTMSQAMAHKDLVLSSAYEARPGGRYSTAGIMYDEMARKLWAARTYNGDGTFSMSAVCGKLDKSVLAQAEAVYDANAKKARSDKWDTRGPGQYKGSGNGWYGKRPYINASKTMPLAKEWKKPRRNL